VGRTAPAGNARHGRGQASRRNAARVLPSSYAFALLLTCPKCSQPNPDGFRFCGSCGEALEPTRARGVRKTVTVLFAAVTGSTALGERLDPESLRRVMSRYFEEMKGVLERHGGTVEKFIGDAVMAVFGIPTLHEDDARRALRASSKARRRSGSRLRGRACSAYISVKRPWSSPQKSPPSLRYLN
jgi:predicted nucleic acid-binding Zn ribbon protein